MRAEQLKSAIKASLTELVTYSDELRDLDQALGDGDLGITVSLGAGAIIEALDAVGDDAAPSEIARACAKAFANANPSTMAALVAGGLLAGSKVWAGRDEVDVAAAAQFVRAAGENIAQRGKTQLGDKTIIDVIMPAADALADATDGRQGLSAAVAAAERAVFETKDLQSRRGRASWLQERSIGLKDPGATAMWRYLQSWEKADSLTAEGAV
jgi:dihydroxyacetone kinase-like protein